MTVSSLFSLGKIIRLMGVGGLVALTWVIVQSCQVPKTGFDSYAVGSLKRLQVLDAPPARPNLTFSAPEGGEMQLSDFDGKVVLLNVWATWCAPCIAEMPTLDALQASRANDDFQVVTVSLDRTEEEAARWFAANNINALKIYHDSSFALPSALEVRGLPVSVFYDRSGRERARVAGEADWMSAEALALIDKLTE